MIKKEEVFKIGIINKPHGVKGEVSFTFTDDIFDRVENCDYLVLLLDGILVPFFIEEYRFRSDNVALVKFEGIDSTEKARTLTNVEVYYPVKFMDDQEEISSWNYFIGFRVEDIHHGCLGTVVDVDDATMNVLFVIENGDEEVLLPAHEEFILDIDRKKKILKVDIPDGLLD
ncbi:ribosome maturation factor RimM [Phocaeicola coprophilus]|uniref:ribosome maturation factor RimM n=1 Tax=Phocaeicola coprophilus TaxID=387090 RepID=UPI0026E0934A|nr:ribosome maturation factor RimM [Phocaeicola coprophilus]